MGIEIWFGVVVAIAVMAFVHKYLHYNELTGNQNRKKFALQPFEKGLLNDYTQKIKRNLTHNFCIEIFIEFYISIFRELSKKHQRIKKLNFRLMDFCMAIVNVKFHLKPDFDDSIYRDTLPKEICELVKIKESTIRMLSDSEERKLFKNDTKRPIRIYDYCVRHFDKNHPEIFYSTICRLNSFRNEINIVHLRNIFYKAYSFMADFDRFISLQCYLHYLTVKSASDTFQYKVISKRNVSKLFDNETQKIKFDAICNQFRQDNDTEKAFKQLDELFMRVRRKISLNIESIKEAKEKHNEVVQILEKYLDNDESETEKQPVVIKIDDTPDNKKDLFAYFISRSFRLNRQEVNIFAKSRGLFGDTFIERINDEYYETLDDLLIEEDGDYYILNEDYYHQLND